MFGYHALVTAFTLIETNYQLLCAQVDVVIDGPLYDTVVDGNLIPSDTSFRRGVYSFQLLNAHKVALKELALRHGLMYQNLVAESNRMSRL